ncbi:hypothetical protein FHS34_000721 [Streptomyces echinatus]|uniref:Uncharacterized protein n=1 Tax=Streptomyces echinatus TaxID=67293 RepID=A0A7W9PP84_9ACTN|nr:hypothetical protein [Streptomyces echinatus]
MTGTSPAADASPAADVFPGTGAFPAPGHFVTFASFRDVPSGPTHTNQLPPG